MNRTVSYIDFTWNYNYCDAQYVPAPTVSYIDFKWNYNVNPQSGNGNKTVSYIDFKWNYNCLTVVNNAYELLVTLILNGITI